MKSKRDEHLKPTSLILQFTQSQQVVDTVVSILDMSVQHCAIGPQTDLVCGPVNFKPSMSVGFVFAELVPHLGMENLRTATGHASQTGISQILKNPLDRFLGLEFKPIDFNCRPTLQMDLRIFLVEQFDDVAVPLVRFLMMQTTDDVHFGASVLRRFLTAGQDLIVVHRIALGVTQVAPECTKPTTVDTNVGRIEVGVDIVKTNVAIFAFADQIGQSPDRL